jgi:hypothetical protein
MHHFILLSLLILSSLMNMGMSEPSTCTGGATLVPNFELDDVWSGQEPIVVIWGPPTLPSGVFTFELPPVTVTSNQIGQPLTSYTAVIGINLTSTTVQIFDPLLNYRLTITNTQLGLACSLDLIPNPYPQFTADTPIPSLVFGMAILVSIGLTWAVDLCIDKCQLKKVSRD